MTWDASAVVVVIGAFGTMAVTVIGSLAGAVLAWQAKAQGVLNGGKGDTIIRKADEIHVLTNSNLTMVTNNLAMALKEIDGLKTLVASMLDAKGAAERAAASAAAHGRRMTDQPGASVQQVEVVNQPLKTEVVGNGL